MLFFIGGFVPYLAACFIILKTKPQQGRWRWIELGIILVGALTLRTMLLPLEPILSPDSWRYLWDARVTLLGYSPYASIPESPMFVHLRDIIFAKMAFRNVPTIYPPGAQVVYLLSYLIAPSNLFVLKGIFVLFDLVTCSALAFLLHRRGLDPSRAIIYAWCPLPIIDFAIQGHLDVIAVMFCILAIVSNLSTWRGSRIFTGFLVGMATLSKIYPILLLVVVIRRRDWKMVTTCIATILLGYLPYLILGHGQIFGFFSTYASQQTPNAGLVQHLMIFISQLTGLNHPAQLIIEFSIDVLLVCTIALVILIMRLNEETSAEPGTASTPPLPTRAILWVSRHLPFRSTTQIGKSNKPHGVLPGILHDSISMEAATLILFGTVFVASSHIFPWYTAVLLPWVAVLVKPIWTRKGGLSGKSLAITLAWYFPCIIIIHYFFDHIRDWTVYYIVVYSVIVVGLCIATIVGIRHMRKMQQEQKPATPVNK